MSYEYVDRRRANSARQTEAAPNRPSLEALRSGAAAPTQEQLGHRVDLPEAMREKMEASFGADLSAVKLYESEAVAEAGANAVTQGTNIAFAPGMLDFTSFGGQSLLGHELSHVVSQARGEVTGGGFLNDRALEARADREGTLAAAGQQISLPASPLSSVSAAAATGPMQASKASDKLVNAEALTPEMIHKAKLKDLQRRDVQDRVLRDFNADLNADLVADNDASKQKAMGNFRDNSGLSKLVYNEMLKRLSEPHLAKAEKAAFGAKGADKNTPVTQKDRVNTAANALADAVENDESLGHMIAGAKGAFANTTHFADDASQSQMLMNNFMLRAVSPHAKLIGGSEWDDAGNQRQNKYLDYAKSMQKAANQNMSGASLAHVDPAENYAGLQGMQRLMGAAQTLWSKGDHTPGAAPEKVYAPFRKIDPSKAGKVNRNTKVYDLTSPERERDQASIRKGKEGLSARFQEKYTGSKYAKNSFGEINDGNGTAITGLGLNRMLPRMERSLGEDYPVEYIEEMYDNLMAPHKKSAGDSPEAKKETGAKFDKGMLQLKKMHFNKLKRLEATYGALGTQLHPEDFLRLAGDDYEDNLHDVQDSAQLIESGGKYFDFENNEEDKEFLRLHNYFFALARQNQAYAASINSEENEPRHLQFSSRLFDRLLLRDDGITPEMEAQMGGPSLSPEQQAKYNADVQKRATKGGKDYRLFGRFKKPESAGT